jgi:syntaxin 5
VVKQRGVFNDAGQDIERLTSSVKADIAGISGRLDALHELLLTKKSNVLHSTSSDSKSEFSSSTNASKDTLLSSVQGITHSDAILTFMKSTLLNYTKSLKSLLIERSESMKTSSDRRAVYGALPKEFGKLPSSSSPLQSRNAFSNQLDNKYSSSNNSSSLPNDGSLAPTSSSATNQPSFAIQRRGNNPSFLSSQGATAASVLGGSTDLSLQESESAHLFEPLSPSQLQAFYPSSSSAVTDDLSYVTARAQDVSNIQQHIADLGSLFSRLATVVAEQSTLVERLEDNVEQSLENVEQGTAQLQRYWTRISSNRRLMFQVTGILILFVILFSTFGV